MERTVCKLRWTNLDGETYLVCFNELAAAEALQQALSCSKLVKSVVIEECEDVSREVAE